ncbi:MAG: DUF2079 domain-containing protein [Candidatus Methanomethylicaceae archaeon]
MHSFAYDLGIFTQSLWSTLHGKIFYETPDLYWNPSGNFLSIHFSIFLFSLLPLYYVLPYVETLLIFQSILLGAAAFFLYALAYRLTKDEKFSKIIVLSYYLSAALHGANLYDFHMEAFIPLLSFSSFYYFIKKKYLKAAFLTFCIGLTIYTLSVLALFILFTFIVLEENRNKKSNTIFLIFIFIIIFYFLITTLYLIPFIGIAPFKPGTVSWFPFLGDSWPKIFYNLIFSPQLVLKSLTYDFYLKLFYWIILLFPIIFLPFFYIKSTIPIIFWLSISLFTNYKPFYTIGWQYVLTVLPFIYISTIYGFNNLKKHKSLYKNINRKLLILAIIQLIISPINPLLYEKVPAAGYDNQFLFPPRYFNIHEIASNVANNQNVIILVTNNLFPHFSNRLNTYIWLPSTIFPDYIAIDISNPARINDKIGNSSFIDQFKKLMNNKTYGIYALKGGVVFFKLNYIQNPIVYETFNVRYDYRNLFSEQLNYNFYLDSESLIVFSGKIKNSNKPAWFGPYTLLLPGHYKIKVKLKCEYQNKEAKDLINGKIEITSNKGNIVIHQLYLSNLQFNKGKWFFINSSFDCNTIYYDVEIRAWFKEGSYLILDYIEILGP